jgi:ribosomal protein S12 methylthiotransferase accessory factor
MKLEVFFEDNLKINAKVGDHIIKTDQPVQSGGENSAPTPFELFLASIGTCSGIFIKHFCANRGIDASGIKLTQSHNFNPLTGLIEAIDIDVHLPEDFPEKYAGAIKKVVDQCAVKRHLLQPPQINVNTLQS